MQALGPHVCPRGSATAVATLPSRLPRCSHLPTPALWCHPAARQQLQSALVHATASSGAAGAGTGTGAVRGAAAAAGVGSGGYQRPLSNQERKAKRAESQRLGRNLCTVNLGAKGLTPAFLEGFRTALAGNELVKVRVGSCDESPEEVMEVLVQAGDCVLVHKIGFTFTFFRDKSLPPPPPLSARKRRPVAVADAVASGVSAAGNGSEERAAGGLAQVAEEEEEEGEVVVEVDAELAGWLESEDAFSDSDSDGEEEQEEEEEEGGRPNSSRRQAAAAKAAKARRPPPPPEFTIIE